MNKTRLETIILAMSFLFICYSVSATNYYCDPVNGSMSNNGSQSSPWSSLQDVFQEGKTFNAGDVINLLSGYHGSVSISGNNTGHVTIQAASDNQPKLRNISLPKASYWTLKGLEISPELASTYNRTTILHMGNSTNIIVDNCEVYSIDDISSWSADDWVSLSCYGIYMEGDNNIIRNCTVRNIDFGCNIENSSDNNLIENNLIKNFSGDGMRVLGNYNTVQYNTIQDNYNVDSNHDDGIQSYSIGTNGRSGTGTVIGNIIRGNKIINRTDVSRPYQGGMHGLGCFDGMFKDWVVENNIIICDHYNGIAFFGAINCKIVNNTVVDINNSGSGPSWIQVTAHKEGATSTGNLVRNNLCSGLNNDANIGTVDHNIEINYFIYDDYFVDFENKDLQLKEGCSAIDAGTDSESPEIDFEGKPRLLGIAVDVGALESGVVCESTEAPTIPANLQAVPDETFVTLTWSASTHSPCYVAGYKILRNGIELTKVYDTHYKDENLLHNTNYEYAVSAISGHGIPSEYCTSQNVTTLSDRTPPAINSTPNTNVTTSVQIVFSEEIDKASAESPANYQIEDGIFINSAQLQSDNKTVVLSVSSLNVGSSYIITVKNVSDILGNTITSSVSSVFSCLPASTILSVNKPVEVDSKYKEEYFGGNAVDGNNMAVKSSRWLSADSSYPHWIEIDLQDTYGVNEVKFWTGTVKYEHPVYDYQIQYWSSGEWVDIVNVTSNSNAEVSHSFPAVNADKIRLYCTNGGDNIVRLFEIEVWGSPPFEKEVVTGVNITDESLDLTVGQTYELKASVEPSNATDKRINWLSSNTSIATVDIFGNIEAKGIGNVTITASTNDGGYTADCIVTVKKQPVTVTNAIYDKREFTIYPNPVKGDHFIVDTKGFKKNKGLNMSIYDVTGKRVFFLSNINGENQTEIQCNLLQGIYIISIDKGTSSIQKKLIVR